MNQVLEKNGEPVSHPDARFCLKNPDVLHTPEMHRKIIAELLADYDALQKRLVEKIVDHKG